MLKLFRHTPATYLPAGFVLGVLAIASSCTVDKTQSAKAPDVDVNVDPGRWPKYNVNWADVDVGTAKKTITVPKLEWKREQTQIEVPYIDINAPNAASEERTVSVEVDVPHSGYKLNILQLRATGDQLWVISELKQTGASSGGPTRVSDQVVVKAPEDLNVRKIIVGQRPDGVFNEQYTFVPDMNALQQKLPSSGGRVLYQSNS